MNEEVKIAYAEVFEILSYMDRKQVMKIPVKIIENIKNNRKIDYKSSIDKNDIFNKNNITRKTLAIVGYFNLNYWVDSEKKQELKELYRKNEYIKSEEQKLEHPVDIFTKNESIKENKALIVKKENIFTRIFKAIFSKKEHHI